MKSKMLALFFLLPWMLAAQDNISKSLRANWQRARQQVVELAEAMPEEKLGFKATPEERTFGEQLVHLSEANFTLMGRIAGASPPEATHPKTRAEILKALADSFDNGDGVLAKLTDTAAVEPIKAGAVETTRLRIAVVAMTNCYDHYGQLVVYLRLNGIVPPASRPRPKT